MIWDIYYNYFARRKPLYHPLQHLFIAVFILYCSYLAWGSITVWEVALFFFMSYVPIVDEFVYALVNYLNQSFCRNIIHLFLTSEFIQMIFLLHKQRCWFYQLTLHNLVLVLVLWSAVYVTFLFDSSLAFYGLIGLLTHLTFDTINDAYEFSSIRKWVWPFYAFWS